MSSRSHVAGIETGRETPSLQLVLRTALLFGVSTDYLLRDTILVEDVQIGAKDSLNLDSLPQLFGTKLRALRTHRHLTQAALARQLGLAKHAYISNLEAGRKAPSLDLTVQLADFFGVTTDYLLRDTIPIAQSI